MCTCTCFHLDWLFVSTFPSRSRQINGQSPTPHKSENSCPSLRKSCSTNHTLHYFHNIDRNHYTLLHWQRIPFIKNNWPNLRLTFLPIYVLKLNHTKSPRSLNSCGRKTLLQWSYLHLYIMISTHEFSGLNHKNLTKKAPISKRMWR